MEYHLWAKSREWMVSQRKFVVWVIRKLMDVRGRKDISDTAVLSAFISAEIGLRAGKQLGQSLTADRSGGS